MALQVRREPYTLCREAKGNEQKRHAHHVRVKGAANRHLVVVRALKNVGVIVAGKQHRIFESARFSPSASRSAARCSVSIVATGGSSCLSVA